MNGPSFATNEGSQFRYKVRVRPSAPSTPPQCLWGSAGLLKNIPFPNPPILHIRNDLFGEPVTFGTQVVSNSGPPTQTTLGTLQPGECVSISLQGYSGVFAICTVESTVYCLIKA
jgi:hypothetical protein